jgi:hypothetical protein
MKIDFDRLEKLAAAGATATVIIEFLRGEQAKGEPKRERDKVGAKARYERKRARTSENERDDATINDTPRARLYREGSAAIMAMGRTDRAARQLISGWLKLTHDDDQLVLGTILRARDLAVADAAGWILATLRGKAKPNGTAARSLATASNDLIARAEEFVGSTDPGVADRSC